MKEETGLRIDRQGTWATGNLDLEEEDPPRRLYRRTNVPITKKKDCDSNTGTGYSKTGERILGHPWFLQTLDTWVCNTGRPLYPLTKESGEFRWTSEHQKAFENIKKALLTAPASALPDLTKPFILYVDERAGVARGVLTQALGP